MLTEDTKKKVFGYLGLALGLFVSVQFSATSNEYDLRNGLSRLYYAFFHASLALLLTQGEDIDRFRKGHGLVHAAIGRRMGKYLGRFLRELYKVRIHADYDPTFFSVAYARDLEKARLDARSTLERASRNFYWIYQEARKAL